MEQVVQGSPQTASYGLRHEVLSPMETLAQSVSTVAPTTTPAATIPLVCALAGNGTWLAYVLATVAVLLVALCIARFAPHSASPGSLYTNASMILPPWMGAAVAWSLLLAYIATGSSVIGGFYHWANLLLRDATGHGLSAVLLAAIVTGASIWIAWRDVKISARLMLWIEAVSVSVIAKDRPRREEAGIPQDLQFQTKWQLSLDIIDQVRGWGLADRIVVSDAAYGDATEFRDGLETRRLRYIVGISSALGVWTRPPTATVPPRHSGRGAPATRHDYGKQRPITVLEAARKAKGWKAVRWRQGTKGWLESRFVAMRVQPSHGYVRGEPPHKEVWLLVEWPESEKEPIKYFFCDLPETYTLRRLVRLAKCRWKIEQDYQQLKEELGLDHYEGRSWIGWHHHTTLVMMAHAFLTLETLRRKKNFWVDPATDAP